MTEQKKDTTRLTKVLKKFFDEYIVSLRDFGSMRLAVSVEQFSHLTKEAKKDLGISLEQSLRKSFNDYIVPPNLTAVELISIDDAIKKIIKAYEDTRKTQEERNEGQENETEGGNTPEDKNSNQAGDEQPKSEQVRRGIGANFFHRKKDDK